MEVKIRTGIQREDLADYLTSLGRPTPQGELQLPGWFKSLPSQAAVEILVKEKRAAERQISFSFATLGSTMTTPAGKLSSRWWKS